MKLLPTLSENGIIIDGSYVKALSFCKMNSGKGKCYDFYQNLVSDSADGIYKCPYGMSVCLKTVDDKKIIFTSFRELETYTKKNKRFLDEKVYNPVLAQEQAKVLINTSLKEDASVKKINDNQNEIDTMLHELRKLNAQIKEHCDSLFSYYGDKSDVYQLSPDEYTKMFDRIKTLYVISTMINTRYSLYSYEKNPDSLTQGSPINTNIYKKFDKCRKILRNYQKKDIPINFIGQSYKGIKAFSSFEMIPFLLLENAVKYSYGTEPISVSFHTELNKLYIAIKSFSPYCPADDLLHIMEKGFRGKNAERKADGNGIGLFFAKTLCDIHNIELSFTSDSANCKEYNGVSYSYFTVNLTFDNVFDMSDTD